MRFTVLKPRWRQRFRADFKRNFVRPYTSCRGRPRLHTLVTTRLVAHPCTVCCTKRQNAVNTSVFGMVAKGMDVCETCLAPHPSAACCAKKRNGVNASDLGIAAVRMTFLPSPPPAPTPNEQHKPSNLRSGSNAGRVTSAVTYNLSKVAYNLRGFDRGSPWGCALDVSVIQCLGKVG